MRRSAGNFGLKLEFYFVLGFSFDIGDRFIYMGFLMMYAVSAETSRKMSYFLFKGHLLDDP